MPLVTGSHESLGFWIERNLPKYCVRWEAKAAEPGGPVEITATYYLNSGGNWNDDVDRPRTFDHEGTVEACPRCGGHHKLRFHLFSALPILVPDGEHPEGWVRSRALWNWAICPVKGEPLLLEEIEAARRIQECLLCRGGGILPGVHGHHRLKPVALCPRCRGSGQEPAPGVTSVGPPFGVELRTPRSRRRLRHWLRRLALAWNHHRHCRVFRSPDCPYCRLREIRRAARPVGGMPHLRPIPPPPPPAPR